MKIQSDNISSKILGSFIKKNLITSVALIIVSSLGATFLSLGLRGQFSSSISNVTSMISGGTLLGLEVLGLVGYGLFKSCNKRKETTVSFEDGLANWVKKEGGRAAEAAERIKEAYNSQKTSLNLIYLDLKTLPSVIGLCTNLQELNLRGNQLTNLPQEIGNCTNLQILNLSGNQLTNLPPELGNCTNLQELYLSGNQLQNLPPEIGNCRNLQTLHLSYNQLQNLPPEIGNCTNLQELYLSGNQLTNLPPEIGNCTNLQYLSLEDNQLQNLPPEIGNCTNLKYLHLSDNQLQNLPPEIGNCINLTKLSLKSNQLQNLPQEIGNCTNLIEFIITHNPSLQSFPLSLGNCSNLTHLSIEETAIPDAQREAILSATAAKRANQSQNDLLAKLALWKGFAGSNLDLDSILQNLEEQQKAIIYEWLIRLERSQDFVTNQQKLAELVCQMLFSIGEGEDYRACFLDHVQANNVRCGDRAAMSLNILYTFWKTEKVLADKPLKEKLELALKIARTNALRENLKAQIDAKEIVQEHKEDERVEIELYYETHLKEELGLETAVSGMLYGDIGRRGWIDCNQLRGYVQDRAYAFLADMEPIKELARKDQRVQDKLTAEREKYDLEQGADESEAEYISRLEGERDQYNQFEQETIISWAKKILES